MRDLPGTRVRLGAVAADRREDVDEGATGEMPMSMSAPFLQELAAEAATTRRVLERVPESSLAWRPHAKSMSLGQLALHVATLPRMVSDLSLIHISEPTRPY